MDVTGNVPLERIVFLRGVLFDVTAPLLARKSECVCTVRACVRVYISMCICIKHLCLETPKMESQTVFGVTPKCFLLCSQLYGPLAHLYSEEVLCAPCFCSQENQHSVHKQSTPSHYFALYHGPSDMPPEITKNHIRKSPALAACKFDRIDLLQFNHSCSCQA